MEFSAENRLDLAPAAPAIQLPPLQERRHQNWSHPFHYPAENRFAEIPHALLLL